MDSMKMGEMKTDDMKPMESEMQQCLDNCQRCHAVCLGTAMTHCLEMGGKHVEPAHLRLMLDCAQMCQTSADFMLRGSSLHALTCGVCAEVCEACAKSCEAMGDMEAYVDACHMCAESCRKMSRMSH